MTAESTGAGSGPVTAGPLPEFQRLLDILGHLGRPALDYRVSVCWQAPGSEFAGMLMNPGNAVAFAEGKRQDGCNVWYGVSASKATKGRGKLPDVVRVPALWLDLDFKDAGMRSEKACWELIDNLAVIGTPEVVIHSGGGLQPLWPMDGGEDVKLAATVHEMFHTLASAMARDLGGAIDRVSDVTRVLRVPGTLNLKPEYDIPQKVWAEWPDNGDRLDIHEVFQALTDLLGEDAAKVAEAKITRSASTEILSSPESWELAAEPQGCPYVLKVIAGWSSDVPKKGRHQWMLGQMVRIAAALRRGELSQDEMRVAHRALAERFGALCRLGIGGSPREVAPMELKGAWEWAIDLVATMTDEQVAAELGNHEHFDDISWPRSDPDPEPEPEAAPRPEPSLDVHQSLEDAFFGASEVLEHIRTAARARMMSPWAVAGCVLAMVAAANDPETTIPAMVGSRASLNIAAALVGPSGSGKSTASDTAEDLLGEWPIFLTRIGAGTGEGLIDTFLVYDTSTKTRTLREFPNAYLFVDEISMVASVQERGGSSFASVLRSMLTGGQVSTTNADPKLRRHLAKRSYSLGAVAGVQPALSDVLLGDADAGTPQRWLWMPVEDPLMPDTLPEWPGELPDGLGGAETAVKIWVDPAIEDLVREHRRLQMKGEADPLDGHLNLTRLKVTALLARLHGESGISLRWWAVSEPLMEVSRRTRVACQEALADRQNKIDSAKGFSDYARKSAEEEAHHRAVERLARKLVRVVLAHSEDADRHRDGHCPKRCLTLAASSRDRRLLEEAVAMSVAHFEWLEEVPGGGFKPGPSRPA